MQCTDLLAYVFSYNTKMATLLCFGNLGLGGLAPPLPDFAFSGSQPLQDAKIISICFTNQKGVALHYS